MQTGMSTMANGKMTKHMVKVFTLILMEHNTMENGLKTDNLEKDLNVGLMVPPIEELMLMEKSMVQVTLPGQIRANSRDSLSTTILMDKASICGMMDARMKEAGKTTKWKVKGSSPGQMVANMWVTMLMTKKRAMEYSHGLMVVNTMVNGEMVSRMVSVCTQFKMEKAKKEDGSQENE